MSHPQSYEILLVPAFADGKGAADKGADTKGSGAGQTGSSDSGSGDAGSRDAAGAPEDPHTKDSGTEDTGASGASVASGAESSGSRAVGSVRPGAAIRSAVVVATGETGESGYPRYAGEGMVADIDPATHTVEALLIDGSELDYGLSVRVSEHHADG
ncbi:hypothetical protein ACIBI8_09960 [Streptomyces sp. NPDC050529]|uniref:hypothetical protein n=1 Tax=Streptomyces sp. NPDC050529 TaxID=3365624 RepID=UPI00379ADF34